MTQIWCICRYVSQYGCTYTHGSTLMHTYLCVAESPSLHRMRVNMQYSHGSKRHLLRRIWFLRVSQQFPVSMDNSTRGRDSDFYHFHRTQNAKPLWSCPRVPLCEYRLSGCAADSRAIRLVSLTSDRHLSRSRRNAGAIYLRLKHLWFWLRCNMDVECTIVALVIFDGKLPPVCSYTCLGGLRNTLEVWEACVRG